MIQRTSLIFIVIIFAANTATAQGSQDKLPFLRRVVAPKAERIDENDGIASRGITEETKVDVTNMIMTTEKDVATDSSQEETKASKQQTDPVTKVRDLPIPPSYYHQQQLEQQQQQQQEYEETAGGKARFVAGIMFAIGVASGAIFPRMPQDTDVFSSFSLSAMIGGDLSFPFRRALIVLVLIAVTRSLLLLAHDDSSMNQHQHSMLEVVDGVLGCAHVVGQVFLCLTTAYLIQRRLRAFIHVHHVENMIRQTLWVVLLLSTTGCLLSVWVKPNLWCLVNLAEAASSPVIIRTLRMYASFTTVGGRQHGRGPVLTQILITMEYWYLFASLCTFLGEALEDPTVYKPYQVVSNRAEFWQLILATIRFNHSTGYNDWLRLLLHSIVLNTIDEMQHFPTTSSPHNSTTPSEGGSGSNMAGRNGQQDGDGVPSSENDENAKMGWLTFTKRSV